MWLWKVWDGSSGSRRGALLQLARLGLKKTALRLALRSISTANAAAWLVLRISDENSQQQEGSCAVVELGYSHNGDAQRVFELQTEMSSARAAFKAIKEMDEANSASNALMADTLCTLSLSLSLMLVNFSQCVEYSALSRVMADDISQLLQSLQQVPRELTRSYSSEEADHIKAKFLELSRTNLVSLTNKLASGDWDSSRERDVIAAVATFACKGEVAWTSDELREIAVSAVDCLGASRQQLVLRHLRELLQGIHASLRHGTREATAESLYQGHDSHHDASNDIVLAHQMTWILSQIGHPHLGKHCQIIMPCVLTALDHYSRPVKGQGLECCLVLEKGMNSTELRWYKDVLLDAVCRIILGCDELWALVVTTAVRLVTRIEGGNARSPWYRKILSEMLAELERNPKDNKRASVFLREVGTQFQAMGLVLVALFKRLFPLLFYWLENGDKATGILVLSCLNLIITNTWIRMPHHANRIREEALKLRYRVSDEDVQSAVDQTISLLSKCVNTHVPVLSS